MGYEQKVAALAFVQGLQDPGQQITASRIQALGHKDVQMCFPIPGPSS